MSTTNKIVWAEGVLLCQQHFQQWENSLRYQLDTIRHYLNPLMWGIITLEIDEDYLSNNHFRLSRCQAIYPHDLIVDYNSDADQPLSLQLKMAPGETTGVFLGIAMNQQINNITGYHNQPINTWQAYHKEIADLYDEKRKKEIMIAKLNLKLLQENQSTEHFHVMKIAEIHKISKNYYQISKEFIPPLVSIKGSKALQIILKKTITLLQEKTANALAITNKKNKTEQILLLQSLYASNIQLQHITANLEFHPEKLYIALAELINKLLPLKKIFTPPITFTYQHENLAACFGELYATLLQTLVDSMPKNIITIPLHHKNNILNVCEKLDHTLLENYDLYIGINIVNSPKNEIISQIKIAAISIIEELVIAALPGIKLTPPIELTNTGAIKPDYQYLQLMAEGTLWEQVKQEQNIAIFLPSELAETKLELIGIER